MFQKIFKTSFNIKIKFYDKFINKNILILIRKIKEVIFKWQRKKQRRKQRREQQRRKQRRKQRKRREDNSS